MKVRAAGILGGMVLGQAHRPQAAQQDGDGHVHVPAVLLRQGGGGGTDHIGGDRLGGNAAADGHCLLLLRR